MLATIVAALSAPVASFAFQPLPRSTPAQRSVDEVQLSAAFQRAAQLGFVKSMIVARDGHVIGEQHHGGGPMTLYAVESVTKSVTAMLVGIAIDHGFIKNGLSARLVDYLPAHLVPADPAKREVLLAHLLTMTAGFQWNEATDLQSWRASPNPVAFILARPLVAPPGTAGTWNHSTATSYLLSVMLTEATGMSTLAFADAYLFSPLGITDRSWEVLGAYQNGGAGLRLRAEDLAKIGVVTAAGGVYGDERIMSQFWATTLGYPRVFNIGAYGPLTQRDFGLHWWVPRGVRYDAMIAWGFGGQLIVSAPEVDLTVITVARDGVSDALGANQSALILDLIFNRVLPAVSDRRSFIVEGLPVPELFSIDEMVRRKMQQFDIRRASAAVVKDGRLVLAHGYTWDEPGQAPTQPTTLFRTGSIAKAITSIAIHQLIERGLLRYDTPVASTLGLAPPAGQSADPRLAEVTVDHLLTHTAGWDKGDGGIDPIVFGDDVVAAALGTETPPTREEIATFMTAQPMQFSPGERWAYCNFGYILLEMLAEKVTGRDFPEWVQDNLFRPIGVGRGRKAHTLESEAFPGEPKQDGVYEGDPYELTADNAYAAGAQVMAAPDLARLFSALFDSSGPHQLLTPATRADMLALPFPASQALGYGRGWFHKSLFSLSGHTMGWLTDPASPSTLYGHGGGGPGVHSIAVWHSDGIVFVLFTNKDPLIHDFDDFPRIQSWPAHDQWASVGVGSGHAGAAPVETWIPVVARTSGVGGVPWHSDVGILNRSPLANQIRLRFYDPSGSADLDLELAPGEYRKLPDVLTSYGRNGIGPLRALSSEALTVTSRTYSQSAAGTYGQSYDGTAFTSGLATGDQVVLMQLGENQARRTNIGLSNGWKRPATVDVRLFDAAGVEVAAFSETIPPEQTMQINRPFKVKAGRSDIASGYATVNIRFGEHVVVYASVVDNLTNDPTTIPAKKAPGDPHQWVAAAAHGKGAHSSQWRTDLGLLNLSGAPAAATVTFYGEGSTRSTSISIEDGSQTVIPDVVGVLGVFGAGALEVVADRAILVSSRTYSSSPAGTLGQYYDGTSTGDLAGPGAVLWLPLLEQNASFRSNIGLVNAADTTATVRVALRGGGGEELASTVVTLSPRSRQQLNSPFSGLAGRDDITAGYARVEVLSGAGVMCYASVVDNLTNDPTTVPAKR